MSIRIIHVHTLSHGGVVEGLVSRDQGNWAEASRLINMASLKCGCQLNGIVGTQTMRSRQEHRIGQEGRGHFQFSGARG
jgi:hypothetical protein